MHFMLSLRTFLENRTS